MKLKMVWIFYERRMLCYLSPLLKQRENRHMLTGKTNVFNMDGHVKTFKKSISRKLKWEMHISRL